MESILLALVLVFLNLIAVLALVVAGRRRR
jgi:hypothetical protein